ncbi:hypothetical protein ES765_05475 [Maribacter sp. ACAM166]|nr:hypothetical protein ES765_05475 [Maribacter sp. ACAM166]
MDSVNEEECIMLLSDIHLVKRYFSISKNE